MKLGTLLWLAQVPTFALLVYHYSQQELSPDEVPRLWNEPLWWLKLVLLLYFPRIFLGIFAILLPLFNAVGWSVLLYGLLLLGSTFFPEWTIIALAFRQHYFSSHPIETTLYFLAFWLGQIPQIRRLVRAAPFPSEVLFPHVSDNAAAAGTGPNTNGSGTSSAANEDDAQPNTIGAALRNLAAHLGQNTGSHLAVLVEAFNALYRQVNTQKRRLSLLDCDPEMLSTLTLSQLQQLRLELSDRVDSITDVCEPRRERKKKRETPKKKIIIFYVLLSFTDLIPETCRDERSTTQSIESFI
jgi:hypothetical protein